MIIVNQYPWPPAELSPNKRIFWRKKNPIKAKYRDVCTLMTKPVKLTDSQKDQHIKCYIVFFPPDLRNRDLDNMLASCKPLIDGLCLRLGINDKNMRPISANFGPKKENGEVRVELFL